VAPVTDFFYSYSRKELKFYRVRHVASTDDFPAADESERLVDIDENLEEIKKEFVEAKVILIKFLEEDSREH